MTSRLRSVIRACAVFAALALASLAPQSLAASSVPPGAVEYRLDTGDKLKVNVFGEDSLSGDYEIDGNGVFSMSLIGEIRARGLTVREFTQNLTASLAVYLKQPRVSAEVVNYRPFYIIGEVKTPGQYPYVNGMSVINSIAVAGGYTYRANENEVIIQRAGTEGYYPADDTAKVLPGDTIIVRERYF